MPSESFEKAIVKFSNQFQILWESFLSHLPEILLATLIFCASLLISNWAYKLTSRIVTNRVEQISVARLIAKAISAGVILLGLFISLNAMNLGKSINGLLAGAGLSGLIIGLALQGTLSNTVSGIVLSFRKNIRVGDWIESKGFEGEILRISLNYLVLKEADNNIVILPSKTILDNPLKNYSRTKELRVVLKCGVAYSSDLERVKEITMRVISRNLSHVERRKQPEFYYTEFGDSSINFICRFWILGENEAAKLKARSNAILNLKKAFSKNGITIPYPIRTLEIQSFEKSYDVNF